MFKAQLYPVITSYNFIIVLKKRFVKTDKPIFYNENPLTEYNASSKLTGNEGKGWLTEKSLRDSLDPRPVQDIMHDENHEQRGSRDLVPHLSRKMHPHQDEHQGGHQNIDDDFGFFHGGSLSD